jgi:hypothetical protein
MGLINLRLKNGRVIELLSLEVHRTYGGLLEGVPTAGLNDRHLEHLDQSLARRYSHMGVHIVPPKRIVRDPVQTDHRGEPIERMPPVECVGVFESSPVENPEDDAWRMSLLVLVWHQDDLTLPFSEAAKAQIAAVDWDGLARDGEE